MHPGDCLPVKFTSKSFLCTAQGVRITHVEFRVTSSKEASVASEQIPESPVWYVFTDLEAKTTQMKNSSKDEKGRLRIQFLRNWSYLGSLISAPKCKSSLLIQLFSHNSA